MGYIKTYIPDYSHSLSNRKAVVRAIPAQGYSSLVKEAFQLCGKREQEQTNPTYIYTDTYSSSKTIYETHV